MNWRNFNGSRNKHAVSTEKYFNFIYKFNLFIVRDGPTIVIGGRILILHTSRYTYIRLAYIYNSSFTIFISRIKQSKHYSSIQMDFLVKAVSSKWRHKANILVRLIATNYHGDH